MRSLKQSSREWSDKVLGKPRQSWSIILFCYNEEAGVRKVYQAIQQVLPKISGKKNEIIIVDDGSQDGSAKIIREIAKKSRNVKAVYHPSNKGIGAALRSGYFAARYENVCAVPADGQFDPKELLPFPIIEEKTFVSFFRERLKGYSLFRKIVSGANRAINRIFLGIKLADVNWVKIYKLKELKKLDLKLQSSLIESEICAKLALRGNRCIETPSIYHPRSGGVPRGASFKMIRKALGETIRLAKVVNGYKKTLRS
jgi:dolichol-phosphate mannosyltransferase